MNNLKRPVNTLGKSASTLDFLNAMDDTTTQGGIPLDLDAIEPDPRQPRSAFRPVDGQVSQSTLDHLQELADDIADNSLLQPIIVREISPGRYMIIAGERRWRAFKLNRAAGLPNASQIPVIIRQDLDAARLRLSQLSENLQREDLSDIETAMYVRDLIADYPELKKKDIGQLLKKNSQYISRMLALLDPEWKDVVDSGAITYGSLLEQFRPLSEVRQKELLALAKSEGRALTSGDIRAAKAKDLVSNGQDTRLDANTSAGAASPTATALGSKGPESNVASDILQTVPPSNDGGGRSIDPSLAADVQTFLAASTPHGETYSPSSITPTLDSRQNKERIIDTGGDANIPTGTKALGASLNQKREAKLTLQQLAKLLGAGALSNMVHQVSLMLPVDEMKAAIINMGGSLPDDESQLPMQLLENINRLPQS